MKFRKTELAILAALLAAVAAVIVLSEQQDRFSDKLIRLHVVADSDSAADQEEKLRVRDAVAALLEDRLGHAEDRGEADRIVADSLREIERVSAAACGKTVRATLSDEYFPTREYETFSLPAGVYRALRVTIGKGAGKNWWCVVFPPVCTGALLDGAAEAVFSPEDVSLMTESTPGYVIKFRLFELVGELRGLFSGR